MQDTDHAREQLLALKVAAVIDLHEDALDVLIEGGFTPLRNPLARSTLAHTVTLEQAFAIRNLADGQAERLISRLLALCPDPGGENSAAPHAA